MIDVFKYAILVVDDKSTRKVMTNRDSTLKSRDITLPTKVHLVKAMVFPVVMYGYENWTIKNLPAMQETPDRFLGWEDPLEKG